MRATSQQEVEKTMIFDPVNKAAVNEVRLPKPIQQQVNELEYDYAKWLRFEQQRVRRGRPSGPGKYIKPVLLFSDTEQGFLQKQDHFRKILGPKSVGNRRHTPKQAKLYADLLEAFYRLQEKKIRLPRGGSLSGKAVEESVWEVLYQHGRTSHSKNRLIKDSAMRTRLGKAMKSVFARVADAIE